MWKLLPEVTQSSGQTELGIPTLHLVLPNPRPCLGCHVCASVATMPLAMPALLCVSTPPHTCVQDVHLSACICVGSASLVSLCGYGMVSSQ